MPTPRGTLIASQEQAVRSAEAQLDTVLANSQAAPKWQRVQFVESIGAAQRRADEARAELARLVAQPPHFAEAGEWRRRAVIAMQAVALIILQITGIIRITSLRARGASEPIIVRPVGPSDATDALLPEPKRVRLRMAKRPRLGQGLDAFLGESRP